MAWEDDEAEGPKSWDNDEPVAPVTPVASSPKAWDNDVPLPANHPITKAVRQNIVDSTPPVAAIGKRTVSALDRLKAPTAPLPTETNRLRPNVDEIYFRDSPESQELPKGAAEYPDLLANDMIAIRKGGGDVTAQYLLDHAKKHGFDADPEQSAAAAKYFNRYGTLPVIGTPHYKLPTIPETSPGDEAGDQADVISRGTGDAGSLGIAPKLTALANSIASGKPYSYELARIRQQDEADMRDHPVTRVGSELVGGAMFPMGEMKSLPQVVTKSALYGGAYNTISSDSNDIGGRILGGAAGASSMAALGATMHGGMKILPWMKGRIWGKADDVHAFDPEGNHIGAYPDLTTAQTKAPGGVYVKNGDVIAHDLPPTDVVNPPHDPVVDDAERVFNTRSAEQNGSLKPEVTELPIAEPEGVSTPEDPNHPVNRLLKAMDEAGVAREKTDAMRHQEMKDRVANFQKTGQFVSGEAGYRAQMAELGGKHKTAEFNPLEHISQDDIDGLFDTIKQHPTFDPFEQVNAYTGLAKLLGSKEGLPTKTELSALEQVFPKDMIDGLSSKEDVMTRIKDGIANGLNVPRALMASMDLSAPGRQGIFLVGTKAYWKAIPPMVKAFGSENVYKAMSDEIASRPTYKSMERAGLALTNIGKKLSDREEAFMSQWAEKIPVVGKLVKASDRAYSGFLNKLRADTFDRVLQDTKDLGIDVKRNPKALRDIAKYVNSATGRGDMGSLNQAAPLLSTVLFSPRLIASRLDLLTRPIRPSTYMNLNPAVRKDYFINLFKFAGLALTATSLAKAGGAEVEADPRSSDFGKIKIGNTRFDMLGGFQQYIRAAAQFISNHKKMEDGSVIHLGEGYKADTRWTVIEKLIYNKFAPIPSMIKDMSTGKDAVGHDLDYNMTHLQQNPIWSRLVPLVFQDINDAYQDAGFGRAAMVAPAAIFGIGTNTYQNVGKNHALKGGGKEDPMGDPNDPVVKEVTRLSKDDKKGLITPPSPSIFIDGKQQKLSDADYARYQKLAAEYIRDDLKKTLASPEYKAMTDEERHDLIKEIVKDQRANARDVIRDSLNQSPKEESGGIIPKAHAAEAPAWANDAPLSIYDFKDGIPTSGHRTPKGNAAVGGATNSDHLDGNGVDYTPAHGQSILELARQARAFFGPSAWIHPEPKKHHVHVSIKGLNAPYIGSRGIQ